VTLIDDEAAQVAADVRQAAYFRAALHAERQHLLDDIEKRQTLAQQRSDPSRLRAANNSAQAQVRYLDRLIARLNQRFAGALDGFD
jgi:hypothetical protein